MVTDFFVLGFGHLSAYIIGIIGYDRYFRLKYLNRYRCVVKMWKIYVSVGIAFFLSLSHGAGHAVGIMFGIGAYNAVMSTCNCVDFAIIMLMLLPYALTICAVKKHRQNTVNRKMLSEVDHTVTSVASRIMIAILLLYLPFCVFQILRRYLPDNSPLRINVCERCYIFDGKLKVQE